MSNWKHYNLIDVADVKLSNVDKKTKTNERTVHLCNYTDVYKNHFINKVLTNNFMIATCSENDYKKFNLKEGQVAITKDSEKADDIGVSTFISESLPNVVLGYHLSLITPNKDQLDGRFLHFWFNTKHAKRYFENNASGSGQRYSLNLDTIKSIPLLLPEISVQQQIAKVLSDLDAKIEVNNQINRELEAMAKLVYDYWFVQFDFPNKDGKPYKSSGGKMVYNEALKREIPEGWEVSTIADWIENDKNGDWGKEQAEGNYNTKVTCVRGADINALNGNGDIKAPTRFILEKNSSKILETDDLIIEISGGSPTQSTGRLAFLTEETINRFDNPLICSNFCKAVTLKDKSLLYNFVYEWNNIYDAGVLFSWEGKTSGIKNLLFENFITTYKIVTPKQDIVQEFYSKTKTIHQKKQNNLIENQQLAALRDWLLPMLMNGQATVGKAYKEGSEEMGMAAEGGEGYQ